MLLTSCVQNSNVPQNENEVGPVYFRVVISENNQNWKLRIFCIAEYDVTGDVATHFIIMR
jgi:hypothetical protein